MHHHLFHRYVWLPEFQKGSVADAALVAKLQRTMRRFMFILYSCLTTARYYKYCHFQTSFPDVERVYTPPVHT